MRWAIPLGLLIGLSWGAYFTQETPPTILPPECHEVGASSPVEGKFVIQYPTTFIRYCAPAERRFN